MIRTGRDNASGVTGRDKKLSRREGVRDIAPLTLLIDGALDNRPPIEAKESLDARLEVVELGESIASKDATELTDPRLEVGVLILLILPLDTL